MLQTKEVDRANLTVHYKLNLPKGFFYYGFDFQKCFIDVGKLAIPSLREVYFEKIENDDKYIISINCLADYKIRKDGKSYSKYIQILNEQGMIRPIQFTHLFIHDKTPEIRKLLFGLLHYIVWKKKFKYYKGVLEYLDLDCSWNMDGIIGERKTLSATREIVSIFQIELEAEQILPNDFIDFYEQKEGIVPIHFELLTEVQRLLYIQSNRSAFLMLYVTFEVATKRLISVVWPDSEWIINNIPSPDLPKIYREYINIKLGEVLSKEDLESLVTMTSLRNSIAHKGHMPDIETVHKYYNKVEEWVSILEDIEKKNK